MAYAAVASLNCCCVQYLAEYGDGANEVNRFTGDDDDNDDDQTNQVRRQTIGVVMTWYTDKFLAFL